MAKKGNLLLVDDDAQLRLTTKGNLELQGWQVETAVDGIDALGKLEESNKFDVALLDVNMPRLDGIGTLEKIKEKSPKTICIMLTAYSDVSDAVKAIKLGAFDYLEKPVSSDALADVLNTASQASNLVQTIAHSAPQLAFDQKRDIIGDSESLNQVFDIIYKLSKVDTPVLIRGESGTGKELVARAIHCNSHRRKEPFVAINCAAIPESLIESELFGHEKGAFTGADKKKIGKFQFAGNGTIFLDELGELSVSMQAKLLRVLQEQVVTPIGANKDIPVHARILAATNQPLEEMMEAKTFREDLFYRLNILPISLPPLRQRREDIPSLVDFMIAKFNEKHKRKIQGMEKNALAKLLVYNWPGNIRELENAIERSFICEAGTKLTLESLPPNVCSDARSGATSKSSNPSEDDFFGTEKLDYPILKEKFEREFIVRALTAFRGKINQTAEHTNMTKVTLLRKLQKFEIDPKSFY